MAYPRQHIFSRTFLHHKRLIVCSAEFLLIPIACIYKLLELIKSFYKNSKDVGMAQKVQKQVKAIHSGELTILPTCKNVAPYSPTSLNVGTMVNAPLCNSLYLFLYILCHPYILAIFVENFYYF